jgi:hypothetical protein
MDLKLSSVSISISLARSLSEQGKSQVPDTICVVACQP